MKKLTVFMILFILASLFLLSTTSFAQKFTIDKKIELDQLPQLKTYEEVILFQSSRNGNVDIYAYLLNKESKPVMTHVASKFIQLTDDQYVDSSPCLSPDGSQIAYVSERNGSYQVIVMNADGSNPIILTEGNYPVWSPDGEKLAFADTDSGSLRRVNKDGSNLYVYLSFSGNSYIKDLSWSLNGQKIAFEGFNASNSGQIWTINAENDASSTKLTEEATFDPAWSPDSSKIAFVKNVSGNKEIFIMDADGTNQLRLTNNPSDDLDPCWTEDNRIVFSSDRTGSGDLYIMDSNGSNQTRLTQNSGFDRSPDWGKISFKN
ncbi:TolB protein [Halanaerobium saccharolyticum]|uniref:TolB protein n=1 Tax=Halanaerobium saccharolyticum TaxID=43595 RepID=A0A4R6LX86_9FIRM|nr:PD40 domain-containing protein [Halanaerobium saccharolyticum]TDO91990.1 TolB protein [Halanaerobium saccharolyticum]